ncbi:LysR substrate-binding domain-containing protein [Vogesella sp. LIG4]|uniref:LysR substrate-binding domain-containing protein n=1 Tax=Vogesella sp. LIG4 TaxID=1192162 RepID=UPI00081FD952|nr:LysR substrate-binding domain-containing protein [Vogesella sp. LIG4]SCK14666.1 DNA-binding transcriptional regulator, LysR family [Vogesella sp. LIG4]
MKLQQLQVFVAVAEEKSLRAAARRLDLTQPAVTRTVQELEHDLGVVLMTRSVQGIALTPYGAALKIRALQLLEDARRAREELQQLKGEMRGKVAVSATSTIALTILPLAIQHFQQAAPETELTFLEVRFPEASQKLRDGSIDFIVSHVLPDMLADDLVSLPLFSADFVVMAREGHPLAHARQLAELADAQWATTVPVGGFQHSVMETAFHNAGLPLPRRLIQCSAFAIALGLVSGTDTLVLFSSLLAKRLAGLGLCQIPLQQPLPALEMSIVMRRDILLTPAADFFVRCLRKAVAALAPEERRAR